MSRFWFTQSISLGLSAAQSESLGKILTCSVRFGLLWAREDSTLSAVGVLSALLWDHAAVQLDLSHLRCSLFLFNDYPE